MLQLSQRTKVYTVLAASTLGILLSHTMIVGAPGEAAHASAPECSDGIDNDVDGLYDFPQDTDCDSMHDATEGEQGDNVYVAVSDGLSEVFQGESPVYTISLRSDNDEPKLMDVRFYLPSYATMLSASEGGLLEGAAVRWRNVAVDPNHIKELFVTVEIDRNARVGALLYAEATAMGAKASDTTLVIEHTANAVPPLAISVNDGKIFAEPEEQLRYQIVVDNSIGPDRTYTMRTTLPPHLRFLGATGGEGFTQEQRQLIWDDEFIPAGATTSFTVDTVIERDAPEFTTLHTKVSAGTAIGDDATTVLYKKMPPRALSISINDGYKAATAGQKLTYQIVLTNNQSKLLTEVEVTDKLPIYTEFVDATEGGYWTGSDVHWKGLTVSPFGTRTLSVTLRVRSDAPLGALLQNTVNALGNQAVDLTEVSDVAVGNTTASANTQNPMLRKVADRTEVRPGDTVQFTIYLRNTLNHDLRDVRIEDRMQSIYATVVDGQSGQMQGDRLVWELPVLEPGKEWFVTYTVRISPATPHGTVITNVVTASGEGMETISLSERLMTGRIGVVTDLPPAGAALDVLLGGLVALFSAGATLLMRRRGLVALLS